MVIVQKAHQQQGLSKETIELLGGAQRLGTKKACDNCCNLWVTLCLKHDVSFQEYHVQSVLTFLIDHQHFTTQHLNTDDFFLSR